MNMTRREITDRAKEIVLNAGPAICLEFTTDKVCQELATVPGYDTDEWDEGNLDQAPEFNALYDEVRKQATRVYAFLGYVAPGHSFV